ncbi:STAS domain-containing protein [Magnetococcus sp. PR-3]|uniref:STAS domain-containing protein n=1 Tax=Magnetococcus sp. PR-3 TaxID=3120355 RepID=UPI002FCE317F
MLELSKQVDEDTGVVILTLAGRFDVNSIPAFQDAYAEHPPGTQFKIYLEKVTYIDSAAFGLFHALKQHLGSQGRVMLFNPSENVTQTLQMLGAHRTFEVIRITTSKPFMDNMDEGGF